MMTSLIQPAATSTAAINMAMCSTTLSRSALVNGKLASSPLWLKDEEPPNSRLFVVCDKTITEKEFREAFSKYGEIEDIWIVKNKHTGERKGVTYIKFAKTSQAAEALENMNGRTLKNHSKPLKVLVANCRSDGRKREPNEGERLVRLFVMAPKQVTEDDLRDHFQQFGEIRDIQILKDYKTGESKGFAYIRYHKASHAAKAFENCDREFKPVFAEPKPSPSSKTPNLITKLPIQLTTATMPVADSDNQSTPNMTVFLQVFGSTPLTRRHCQSLFSIVPGLDFCEVYTGALTTFRDLNNLFPIALIKYNTTKATQWALEKFQQFEYPPGSPIFLREVTGAFGVGVSPLM
ncbi:hypothetical protein CHUAL_013185 [Chamberlinius hualienensis]